MKIKKISIQNFKNISKIDIDFDDKLNVIKGMNGIGKTSILEAIYFCISGNIRGVDKNKKDYITNINSDFCNVVLFIDDNLIIDRLLSKGKSTLTVNGIEMSQKEFEMKYNIDIELFQIIHFASDFMKLDIQERRDNLVKILGKMNRYEIFVDRFGSDIYEKYKFYIDFNDLNKTLSTIRKLKKEQEDNLSKLVTEKHLLLTQLKELKKNLLDCKVEYDVLKYEEIKNKLEDIKKKKPKLDDYISKASSDNLEVLYIKEEIKKNERILNSLVKPEESKLHVLSIKIDELNKELENVRKYKVCPTCLRPYSIEDISKMIENIENKIKSSKEMLDKEKEKYNLELQEYNDKVNKIKSTIKELEDKKERIIFNNSAEIDKWKLLFTNDFEEWEKMFNEVYNQYIEEEKKYNKYIANEKFRIDIEEKINIVNAKINKIDESFKNINIEELENLEYIFSQNGIIKIEINNVLEQIKQYIPEYYNISLIRGNKTNDEIKETFEVYNQYNIEYKWWSDGNKLLFDIFLSILLVNKSIFNFILVDGLEKLSNNNIEMIKDLINKNNVQFICTQVGNNDKIEIINNL